MNCRDHGAHFLFSHFGSQLDPQGKRPFLLLTPYNPATWAAFCEPTPAVAENTLAHGQGWKPHQVLRPEVWVSRDHGTQALHPGFS